MTGAKIEGIRYEEKVLSMGTAGTHKVAAGAQALHYWVRENDNGEIDICYVKPDGTPTPSIIETVTREDFARRFKECSTHECDFRKKTKEEKIAKAVEEKVRTGDAHMEKKEFNAAKFEYGQALKADQEHLGAHLGKGKAHMALGEVDEAKKHFEKMAATDALYDEDHMHTFNELGITLRRSGMLQEAIRNYAKALEMAPDDEALHYNIARALKEAGNAGEAAAHLKKALELKPTFKEAKEFLDAGLK